MAASAQGMQISLRQRQLYQFIDTYQAREGRPPTLAEMQRALGARSTSVVRHHLNALVKGGFLHRAPATARGVRTAASGRPGALVRVPLRGDLAADAPLPDARGDAEAEAVELARGLAPGDGLFALRVRGCGLLDVLLNDGDLVVLAPRTEARNGELVAVRLLDSGAIVLKRWHREPARVCLSSDDPHCAPLRVPPDRVQVQAAVVTVIRALEQSRESDSLRL